MSTKQPKLMKPTRTCCGCGKSEDAWKREGREVVIGSVYTLLYIRPIGAKSARKMGPKVEVCEECLVRFLAGTIDSRTMEMFYGILNSLRKSYNAVLEGI